MAHNNIYTVNGRLAELTSRVSELEAENKRLRVHLAGELQTAIHAAKHFIQDSIRVPVDGKDGRDGAQGPQGIQGVPGRDCTMPTESELADAVNALRLKLAKWQAAVLFQYEQNTGRKHQGLRAAIDAVLKNIERDAGL